MKYLIIIICLYLFSCTTVKTVNQNISMLNNLPNFKNELNKSIIDGFYNNDTIGISKTIYLIK